MVQAQAVKLADGGNFPAAELDAVQPLPVQNLGAGDRAGTSHAGTALRIKLTKHGPQPGARGRQWLRVQLGHVAAVAGQGLVVFAAGVSIGQPLCKVKLGLCVGGKRFAQALIKSSRRRVAAISCSTSHCCSGSFTSSVAAAAL